MNVLTTYIKSIISLSILAVTLAGCEELYVPDIDAQTPVIVIEGLITDQATEHYVRVSKTVGFNDDQRVEYISVANVTIEEKDGISWTLTEKSIGHYVTDTLVKGQIDHLYRVVVTDADGIQFSSAYDTLKASAPIEAIGGRYHAETWLEDIGNGNYMEKSDPGVMVLSNIVTTGYTPYYRYEYDVVFQTTQTYPTQPWATVFYIAQPMNSKKRPIAPLANSNKYQQNHVIDLDVDFISDARAKNKIVIDSMEIDSATGLPIYEPKEIITYQHGFLVQLSQYSLSHSAYLFWEGINKQMNSTGHIFDPVESRIDGNIICDTDSSMIAFGFFGASSVTIKANHLYKRYDKIVVVKPVKYFPDLDGTIASTEPFDFWVR